MEEDSWYSVIKARCRPQEKFQAAKSETLKVWLWAWASNTVWELSSTHVGGKNPPLCPVWREALRGSPNYLIKVQMCTHINEPSLIVIHKGKMFTLFSRWKIAVNPELLGKGETGNRWEHKITCWTLKLKQETSLPDLPSESSLHSCLKKTKESVHERFTKSSYMFAHNVFCNLQVWLCRNSLKKEGLDFKVSNFFCFSHSSRSCSLCSFIPRSTAMFTSISYMFPYLRNTSLTRITSVSSRGFLNLFHLHSVVERTLGF